MVAAVIAVSIWAVVTTALWIAEHLRAQRAEHDRDRVVTLLEATTTVSSEHDAWLRTVVERGFDSTTAELAAKQAIIERLVVPEEKEEGEMEGSFEDARLDVELANTRDWTDGDPALWGTTEPTMLGQRAPWLPGPDIEEEMGG